MSDPDEAPTTAHVLTVGTKVEVRTGFDGDWTNGFAVADQTEGGYRIRRRSDGTVLPKVFDAEEVRRERRNSMWWY